GIDLDAAKQLVEHYGSNVEIIYGLYKDNHKLEEIEAVDTILMATLLYAIDYELAYTPSDYFIRRTGALFFNIDWVIKHREKVVNSMANILKWSQEELEQYDEELR